MIDPIRTMTMGKVEIGAFRTYPQDYTPPGETNVEDQAIPLDKIEDFGVHYKKYYSCDVSFFKTSLDNQLINVLWNKYWITTMTQSSIFTNQQYYCDSLCDLSRKVV